MRLSAVPSDKLSHTGHPGEEAWFPENPAHLFIYLVEVFIAEEMDLSRLEAVLALALVKDVGLELPAGTLSGGHHGSGTADPRFVFSPPSPKNSTAQSCRSTETPPRAAVNTARTAAPVVRGAHRKTDEAGAFRNPQGMERCFRCTLVRCLPMVKRGVTAMSRRRNA